MVRVRSAFWLLISARASVETAIADLLANALVDHPSNQVKAEENVQTANSPRYKRAASDPELSDGVVEASAKRTSDGPRMACEDQKKLEDRLDGPWGSGGKLAWWALIL
ncbi:hypothetical protein GQ44DRAFT_698129 [Phaeosphaeriaceae sp. PMI808]|nr:hypothetical protein GQ44DRAFT_698129 [Phaeosphaeriaceae sp. PMI808]